MPHPRRTLLLFAFVSSQLMVCVGAGLTAAFGPLETWSAMLIVIGLVGVFWWLWSSGVRNVPLWLLGLAFALMMGTAYTMEFDERLAPLCLALGLLALFVVRRLPLLEAPKPQFHGGTASTDPAREIEPPSPGVAEPATEWSAPPLPAPDPSRRAPVPPTAIDLAPGRMRLVLLGVGAATAALGVFVLWALYFDDQVVELAGRVLGTFFGLLFLGVGLFILLGGLTVARGHHLTVDARGMRREGSGPTWDLDWSQVAAVGLRVRERSRSPMTNATGINRRRTITLLIAVTDPAAQHTPAQGASIPPFTHRDPLPDLHPGHDYSPTVIELDQAFRKLVPDLYVGVLQD